MKPPKDAKDPDFEQVLANPRLRKPFQDFLEQQFCAENLNFYLFVERYKGASEEERGKIGKDLFDQHFAESAAEPVNVESAIMRSIKEAVHSGDFRPDLFSGAQYHVFHIMKFDVWPRFQKSDSTGASTLEKKGSIRKKDPNADSKPESKRKSLLPWKVMRNKKKESTASGTGTVAGTSSAGTSAGTSAGGSTSARGGNPTPVSAFLGVQEDDSDKNEKRNWRQIKQHSMPSQSVEGVKPPSARSIGLPTSNSGQGRGSEGGLVLSGSSSAPSNSVPAVCVLVEADGTRETHSITDATLTARAWFRNLCLAKDLDPAATELLDQNGEILISARDSNSGGPAVQSLANRTLRLSRLVEFRLDIPIPISAAPTSPSTSSAQHHTATDIKQVMVQARAESPSGGVLRNVLRKYNLELDSFVVGFAGTTEVLPSSEPIGRAAGRRLFIMSGAQFSAWMHGARATAAGGVEGGDGDGSGPASPIVAGRRFPSISSGGSRAHSPAFTPLPHTGGSTAVAELPDKAAAASLHVPGKPKAASLDSEDASSSLDQPQLRPTAASFSNPSLRREEEPGMLKHVKKAAQGAPLALRKSLEAAAHHHHHHHHQRNDQPAAKRQTLANSEELRKQMEQDSAMSELWSRTGHKMDDQTAGGPLDVKLPEFLLQSKEKEGDVSGEDSFEAGSLPPEAVRAELTEAEGALATPSKGEAVFGRLEDVDFADPEMTSRRALSEFGLGAPSSKDVLDSGSGGASDVLGRLCASNLVPGSRTPVLYLSPKAGPNQEPTLLKADYV